jgi:type II secretory pathway pseudopilin PulG
MNIIKTNRRAGQSGTTLIELSVVIAVILLLVGVLFVGVTAWKANANKAACLVNLASLQKAVRGYENAHTDTAPTTIPANQLVTDGYFGAIPTCPANGKYTPDASSAAVTIPAPGNAAFACAASGHAPTAANLANW